MPVRWVGSISIPLSVGGAERGKSAAVVAPAVITPTDGRPGPGDLNGHVAVVLLRHAVRIADHKGVRHPRELDRYRVGAAARQVVPFALAASAAPVASIALGAHVQPGVLVMSFVVLFVVSAGMVGVLALSGPAWLHDLFVLVSFGGLSLAVSGAGGAGSGLMAVLMVPVIWMALYGRWRGLAASLIVEVVAALAVSATDPAGLTPDDRRRVLAILAVSALTAWTVFRLVRQFAASERTAREGQRVLVEVAEAARALREGPDARQTVCEAVVTVAEASSALLFEPDGPVHLAVTASAGTPLPHVRIPLGDRSVAALAYLTGQPCFVPEAIGDPRVNPTLARLTAGRSVLAQPFHHGGAVRGVVVAVWPHPLPRMPEHAGHALALLAQEIGTALERADLIDTLSRRASTDTLTGLANRRVWRDNLPALMAAPGPLAVALLDLDHFKTYNDERGHLAGDDLLHVLGRAWRPLLRHEDLLVRWGGEEFALAMPGCPLAEAREIVERLRSAVPYGQTVSAGVTTWDGQERAAALLARADVALYRAKNNGRDRVVAIPATDGETRQTG